MGSKYRPILRLAVGGMAEVLVALRAGAGFEKLVVVKRLLEHISADRELAGMFLDEARLAARLRHPNIVETLDLYQDEGVPHLVMEYVRGEDLHGLMNLVRKNGEWLPVKVACRIAADVASALAYAHGATDEHGRSLGLVHRDVGPRNIMLTYDGVAKLLDFGVAKAANATTLTQVGTVKGKLGYLSPEQMEGQPVDGRADIFSLGVVVHEMLTGQRLFAGKTELELVMAVATQPIEAPSHKNPEVPPELDQLVLQMLDRDRDKRIASANVVHTCLKDIATQMGCRGHSGVATWVDVMTRDTRQKKEETVKQAIRKAKSDDDPTLPSAPPMRRRATMPPQRAVSSTIDRGSGSYRREDSNPSYRRSSVRRQRQQDNSLLWVALGAIGTLVIAGAVMVLLLKTL